MTGNIHFLCLISMQFFIAASAIIGIAFASTIEVPTYDPPMTLESEINGTKTLDFFGNEDSAFEMVQWRNYTIMTDISDYNHCITEGNKKIQGGVDSLTLLTNNITESEKILSLSPEQQREYLLDHCLAVLHISNVMEKAFGDAFGG